MEQMSKLDTRWSDVLSNALLLVEGGRISEGFPLYHSWYDYATS